MVQVLVVDDDANARLTVSRALTSEGFDIIEAPDGPAALAAVAEHAPDIVLLDVNLPHMSGLEVLTALRRDVAIPVILLTGRGQEIDRVLGLELGGDDYIVKPFSVRELAARVRSVLRRTSGDPPAPRDGQGRRDRQTGQELSYGPLHIKLAERAVLLSGSPVDLTPKEFDLLAYLAAAPRKVFTRDELLKEVWGSASEWQDPATVTEHVRRIRRKIEREPERPQWVTTVRGVGYRFEPPT